MLTPKQHQIIGAEFLASRKTALLADQPRVGKTGAAIMAADMVGARKILAVTTASGRPVWRRGFQDWSIFGRRADVLSSQVKLHPDTEIAIVGWPDMRAGATFHSIWREQWDVLILDEAHYAKSLEAQRTQAVFGTTGLALKADRVWCLSGTPMPNSPFDLYPMLAMLAPERLAANRDKDWPDVSDVHEFRKRYCKVKPKKIGFHRWIDVIIGGQNLDELAARIDGFYLRRTQQDVGITSPIYEILPLMASPSAIKEAQRAERSNMDAKVLERIEAGDTEGLRDEHMGPVRRIWGELKIQPLLAVLKEEFENGLDKIVIAAWHQDVIHGLADGLATLGYGGWVIDGSSSAKERALATESFQADPSTRWVIGQIQAAGEAIDLSAASELLFAESSFVPSQMQQMAFRITNHGQTRQPRVRVAVLEGSIDDALQSVLLRKWSVINEVMK